MGGSWYVTGSVVALRRSLGGCERITENGPEQGTPHPFVSGGTGEGSGTKGGKRELGGPGEGRCRETN